MSARVRFNSTIVTRISGIPFYRRDSNEASKLLSVHRDLSRARAVFAVDAALQIRLVTYHKLFRRMHYSSDRLLLSRRIFYFDRPPDRARWRAF